MFVNLHHTTPISLLVFFRCQQEAMSTCFINYRIEIFLEHHTQKKTQNAGLCLSADFALLLNVFTKKNLNQPIIPTKIYIHGEEEKDDKRKVIF